MSNLKRKTDASDFTSGSILGKLIAFALPVLFAMFLQSMYGAVDLLVVGQFASSADVSAVATGAQIMMTFTGVVAGISMGLTIILGQQIGLGRGKEAGTTIGAGIVLFAIIGAVLSVILAVGASGIAGIMKVPEEAFTRAVSYIRICGGGMLVIITYNLIGGIFRGIGDSETPLVTVAIACAANIAGDLLLVAGFRMGSAGAAIATVAAQALSVAISFLLIRKKALPFVMSRDQIRWNSRIAGRILSLGLPIAIQDALVSVSFLAITAIVNNLGVVASAGVGVAERVCGFIMLVSSSFSQSLAAFVAQNYGAGKFRRARRSLYYCIGVSLAVSVFMFALAFFRGDLLAGIFSTDPEVIAAAADYLKAYAIDTLLTAVFFCYIGYFNGIGLTRFVMVQGIVGAFLVRLPVSWWMSRQTPVSLFRIGLATPASSLVQLILCVLCMAWVQKNHLAAAGNDKGEPNA